MNEPDEASGAKRKCVGCGAELPAGASPNLCPKCLLKLAMETQPASGPGGTAVVPGGWGKSRGLPQPGEQLGHYSIIRLLGAGGMGAVYEAQDLESGRRIALKVLSHTLDSPDARERFFREGRLAASINHPNSVFIFGTEEIGGTPVITMELVPGGTLQDRVRARGPLPVGEAVDAVLQLMEGLEAAQRLGILHRDIKPSNCYVGEDGAVKIGDFGLSISTAVRTEPALTATGAFLGTPAFCSPEQLRGDELNARSDMYSVGATLYYLLTGRTPFETKNMVQLLATVLEQRPPSPRQFRAEIPRGLARVILRCLEKQPGERFKNYADVARALAPYGSTAPTPATLGLRFLAGVVDMALLGTLAMVINVSAFGSAMGFLDQAMHRSPKALACIIGWFCVTILYYALLEGLWGAAAGKALCRLRVVGTDRNPPGVLRAGLRAMIYLLPPLGPYWVGFGTNPKAIMSMSQWAQLLVTFSIYGIMALLFVTARRRNGFAAVQDLWSGTRVVSRGALVSRPVLTASEPPPPAVESAVTVGPYHVLQTLSEGRASHSVRAVGHSLDVGCSMLDVGCSPRPPTPPAEHPTSNIQHPTSNGQLVAPPTAAEETWLLAYDLKLLRKVWLRVVPPGTEPVPAPLRNLGRVGRVRWLTGSRSPAENWDAFEALNGRPFLKLVARPQPWQEVRYWLHDLAAELSAATKDGTLPELGLDRVWITGEGRAKLLDFVAPGLAPAGSSPPPLPGSNPAAVNSFLNAVANDALAGSPNSAANVAGAIAAPLPLHARAFLRSLPQMTSPETVAAALKPLLGRVAAVTRLRRAALVAGCAALPLFACAIIPLTTSLVHQMTEKAPGAMELNMVVQMRTSGKLWGGKNPALPSDRLFEIYIAQHYGGLITNQTAWTSWPVISLVQGEGRKFAEKSVADYPSPSQAEIAEADAALGKHLPKDIPFVSGKMPAGMSAMMLAASLLFYVGIPAVVAALLFRGGLVLLFAGVTYVRKDGERASRLRLLWRALVTWAPAVPVFVVTLIGMTKHSLLMPWLAIALLALLAILSIAFPRRGPQDLLAGTWPVPR
jgi:eukaryotic-like serine/threonine-protein kinase